MATNQHFLFVNRQLQWLKQAIFGLKNPRYRIATPGILG